MGFSLAYLKRGLPLAVIAFAVVFSAPAQRTAVRRSQPILFSSPESDTAVSNVPSLSPKPPESLALEDIVQAPETFNLNRLSASEPLPWGTPGISPAEIARERDLQDRRRNWTLLTPAEILGAATPEKILGIVERDGFGQPKNSTALERYTERQNQMLSARTNALQAGNPSPTWNSFSDLQGSSNFINGGWRSLPDMANPLFNPAPDNQIQNLARQNENNGWAKLFDQPSPGPAPNTAQQTDMERFRQLLNPDLSSLTPAATPSAGGIKTSLPQTLLGSGLAQSPPVRIGGSFIPLNNDISKPPDLPKLPSVWSLSYTSPPPATAWTPQPAPWLSPTPQPFVAPQRKF